MPVRLYTPAEAREFCKTWLPAWTGNDPERLATFYTDDLFYCDPTVPNGVRGKPAFINYMKKLLGNNPNWVWTHESGIPMQDGFVNKWQVLIPVGDRQLAVPGVCLVQLRDGSIYRNEVYFDTLELVTAIHAWNARKPARRGTFS
jgi:hypothetical protein